MAQRLYISSYLKNLLNSSADVLESNMFLADFSCKDIANDLGLSVATISNLNTNSRYETLYDVACCIYDKYYSYFSIINKKYLIDAIENEENSCFQWWPSTLLQDIVEYSTHLHPTI